MSEGDGRAVVALLTRGRPITGVYSGAPSFLDAYARTNLLTSAGAVVPVAAAALCRAAYWSVLIRTVMVTLAIVGGASCQLRQCSDGTIPRLYSGR